METETCALLEFIYQGHKHKSWDPIAIHKEISFFEESGLNEMNKNCIHNKILDSNWTETG